ncbi:MAG: hypothetical protein CVU39_20310 [Chloroflexi bacterium HGW-Chloroflexi-10]|nr:MAG: hypothetical protein CVU39_20310 [Chloroflexi bacterium HGW-Chloroflexi-10]
MDLGSIFLILGLSILVAFIVIRPFFEISNKKLITRTFPGGKGDQRRSVLMAERERVLRALQELEFDFALGKIPAEDYPEQRNFLKLKAADTIKQLDELIGNVIVDSVEEKIEAAVHQNRIDGKKEQVLQKDPDIESLVANRRREKEEKPASFCPKCGKAVTATDKFCGRCGSTL